MEQGNKNINHNHHPFIKLIFISLSLGVLLMVLSFLFLYKKPPLSVKTTQNKENINQSEYQTSAITPTMINIKEKGVLSLKTKNNQRVFTKEDKINILLYAFTDNQPIVGYDVVLMYDEKTVKFQDHNNLLSDFKVFIKEEKDQLIITGIKNIDSQSQSIFSNTPILELAFQPKISGKSNFSLFYQPNQKNDTNLINEKSEDILGKTEEITLEIN